MVCKRYEGPAAVICYGAITPAEGLEVQETEMEAAKVDGFTKLYYDFLLLFL